MAAIVVPDIYTVVSGDSLYKIGQRYGIDWHNIALWNNIPSPYYIVPGQILKLKAPTGPIADTTPPTAPTGLKATQITQSGVTLAWSEGTDNTGVVSYMVYRDALKIATVTALTCLVTGLAAGTAYTFSVRSVDAAGNQSDLSTKLTCTTLAPTPPPVTTPPPVVVIPPPMPDNFSRPPYWPTNVPNPLAAPPTPSVTVGDSIALANAVAAAAPGTVIGLRPGSYSRFQLAKSNITIVGPRDAVFNGGAYGAGYAFQIMGGLTGVRLIGFGLRTAQKGFLAEGLTRSLLQDLEVYDTGSEAVAVRNNSTDNLLYGLSVHDSGKYTPKWGEGIYIGSWSGNWPSLTTVDRSDRNVIYGVTVVRTGAESIDVKEGTTGGIVENSHLDGTGMSGQNYADSPIDLQGNAWKILRNTIVGSTEPGFGHIIDLIQTHTDTGGGLGPGWGDANVIDGNVFSDAPGYAVNLDQKLSNVVKCGQSLTRVGRGLVNGTCTP